MVHPTTGEAPALEGAANVAFDCTLVQRGDGSTCVWPLVAFSPRKAAIAPYIVGDAPDRMPCSASWASTASARSACT